MGNSVSPGQVCASPSLSSLTHPRTSAWCQLFTPHHPPRFQQLVDAAKRDNVDAMIKVYDGVRSSMNSTRGGGGGGGGGGSSGGGGGGGGGAYPPQQAKSPDGGGGGGGGSGGGGGGYDSGPPDSAFQEAWLKVGDPNLTPTLSP